MTVRRLFLLGGALAAGVLAAAAAAADEATSPMPSSAGGYARLDPSTGGDAGRPKTFASEARGFVMPVPPGAKVEAREGGAQVAVQSRRGYAVNLQTADANPDVPLKSMIGRLDDRYLGEGRPWSAKVLQRETRVHGMPAMEAVYAGGSTKVRAVIARGAETDFVFLFFAPATMFEQFDSEFTWILENFRPAEPELAGLAAPESKPAPLHSGEVPAALATGRPAPEPQQTAAAPAPAVRRFDDPGFGYVMEYPDEWVVEKAQAFTTLFSGRKGTPAYDAIVSVQNVRAGEGVENAGAEAVLRSLKEQLGSGTRGLKIVGEKAVTYDRDGHRLEGRQFVADYEHGGRAFRKWTLVVPRPGGDVAHVWSYTAPLEFFETYRPVAEGMLRSWTISDARG